MELQLQGKTALVTGASRGIGKAIARQLAAEGVDLVLSARGEAALIATAAELAAESGRRVVPIVADHANTQSVQSLVQQAIAALGHIDILINNAAPPGGLSSATSVLDIDDALLLEDVNIKVLGYVRVIRALVPHLLERGGGRIINIGGLSVRKTGKPVATLRNAGVVAIAKSLADEFGPQGIGVVTLHPGATRTDPSQPGSTANGLNRVIEAEEVAQVATFLASPLSRVIQGEVIAVGGGTPGPIHY